MLLRAELWHTSTDGGIDSWQIVYLKIVYMSLYVSKEILSALKASDVMILI
jgi:hypothetical protein